MDFPHLQDNPQWPGVPSDIYDGEPTFDYRQWTAGTKIKICSVPWDSSYSDVVAFDTIAARDKYLDGIAGLSQSFDSMFHVLPVGGRNQVKLPIPAQAIQNYNYIVIDLPAPPVAYTDFVRTRFCFFLLDVTQAAPSTSACTVALDVWATFANDLDFDYMVLERGHWPMAQVSAADYLKNPMDNSTYLLAPDVSYGDISRVTKRAELVINNDSWCVFFSSADWRNSASWGTVDDNTLTVPNTGIPTTNGAPAPHLFACDPSKIDAVLAAIEAQIPWAFKTVKAIAFIPKKLVTVVSTFTFCGQSFSYIGTGTATSTVLTLDKAAFGYPSQYADLAKLYTYPYAAIELTDGRGKTTLVRIEDTPGRVWCKMAFNSVFPNLKIRADVLNIGSATNATIDFQGTAVKFSQVMSGFYYKNYFEWDMPTFVVYQPANIQGRYDTNYSRYHNRVAYTNAYDSAIASNATANTNAKASNATANTNAKASNATAQTNANNSASNITSNNSVTVAANTSTTATSNAAALQTTTKHNQDALYSASDANEMSSHGYHADKAGLAVSAANNDMQATNSVVQGIVGGVASALAGDLGGVMGAVGGVVNAGVSAVATANTIKVSQSNSDIIFSATTHVSTKSAQRGANTALDVQTLVNNTATTNTATNNNAATSIANNNANLTRTNAANTRTTADANADRTKATGDANADRTKATGDANAARSRDTAINGNDTMLAQAQLQPAAEFGTASASGETMTSPMAVIANVVTQAPGALAQAATQFLRYGYQLNQQIQFKTFNVMKHFSYWQLQDVWWVTASPIDGQSQDKIRDILTTGVTVWRDPTEIGAVSVYDN